MSDTGRRSKSPESAACGWLAVTVSGLPGGTCGARWPKFPELTRPGPTEQERRKILLEYDGQRSRSIWQLKVADESIIAKLIVVEAALVLSALSQITRRKILALVTDQPRSLSDLARACGQTVPGILVHVRLLERAELVASKRKGKRRIVRSRYKKIDLVYG